MEIKKIIIYKNILTGKEYETRKQARDSFTKQQIETIIIENQGFVIENTIKWLKNNFSRFNYEENILNLCFNYIQEIEIEKGIIWIDEEGRKFENYADVYNIAKQHLTETNIFDILDKTSFDYITTCIFNKETEKLEKEITERAIEEFIFDNFREEYVDL